MKASLTCFLLSLAVVILSLGHCSPAPPQGELQILRGQEGVVEFKTQEPPGADSSLESSTPMQEASQEKEPSVEEEPDASSNPEGSERAREQQPEELAPGESRTPETPEAGAPKEQKPRPKEKVLLVGDSQFRTHYGPEITKQLILAGYIVKLVGCGGSAAVHYLGQRKSCIGIQIPSNLPASEPFLNQEYGLAEVRKFYKQFPLQKLADMIQSFQPDHVIVSLGTNSISPQLVKGFKTIMKQYEQMAAIASKSSSCTWIGPFRLSSQRYKTLPETTWKRGIKILEGLVTKQTSCVFLDGLTVSQERDLSSDGLHLSSTTSPATGGKAVARRLAPQVLKALQTKTPPTTNRSCPAGMVYIPYTNTSGSGKPFCIDAYEVIAEERQSGKATGRLFSPYYPPNPTEAKKRYDQWEKLRKTMGSQTARAMPLPPLPTWYNSATSQSRAAATAKGGVIPQGYLTGVWAETICKQAGKRLCTKAEWKFACRGPRNKTYPYGTGDSYITGKCNIHRNEHPAVILHNKASLGHRDPRLNQTKDSQGNPLLRKTGATQTCYVEWPDGKLYDMVGNLDEWVADRRGVYGTFVGGFYSRAQKRGCEASIGVHAFAYSDYSLGTRCCAAPR